MNKRSIFTNKDGKKFYKKDVPLYFSVEMVAGLAKDSGKSATWVMKQLSQWVLDLGHYGLGHGTDYDLHFYVIDDGLIYATRYDGWDTPLSGEVPCKDNPCQNEWIDEIYPSCEVRDLHTKGIRTWSIKENT